MDGSLLALALTAPAVTGGLVGFVLGLRVCGPKLDIGWTERHPREIAEEIASGRRTLNSLTPRAQRIVLGELARMRNGLTVEESNDFVTLIGIGSRFERHPECAAVRDWAEATWYQGPASALEVDR